MMYISPQQNTTNGESSQTSLLADADVDANHQNEAGKSPVVPAHDQPMTQSHDDMSIMGIPKETIEEMMRAWSKIVIQGLRNESRRSGQSGDRRISFIPLKTKKGRSELMSSSFKLYPDAASELKSGPEKTRTATIIPGATKCSRRGLATKRAQGENTPIHFSDVTVLVRVLVEYLWLGRLYPHNVTLNRLLYACWRRKVFAQHEDDHLAERVPSWDYIVADIVVALRAMACIDTLGICPDLNYHDYRLFDYVFITEDMEEQVGHGNQSLVLIKAANYLSVSLESMMQKARAVATLGPAVEPRIGHNREIIQEEAGGKMFRPKDFHASLIQFVGGLEIRWTHRLDEHLQLSTDCWGGSPVLMLYCMDNQAPTGIRGLWRDKRNSYSFYTLWLVIIFGGTSILLALLSLAVSAAQTWAAFHPPKDELYGICLTQHSGSCSR
ncbi:hypothetical protein VTL71DRAFT_14222 [Oculimacula yallundae]|uniref:Uncharacterized protein n=1 Tax=Oculimacula yallundae TaxID=86028 RepID=A0ABR4CHV2_9HELO